MFSIRFSVCAVLLANLVACGEAAPRALPAAKVVVHKAEPDQAVSRLPLAQRLVREAEARPAHGVRGESLRRRMLESGVVLVRTRQVLGEPLGASYCEASLSRAGSSVAVCEYADHAAAEAGLARSRELFDRLIPGRTLLVNENALLTLVVPEGELAQRQKERVASLFAALTPVARAEL